jgi:hypothetical protein
VYLNSGGAKLPSPAHMVCLLPLAASDSDTFTHPRLISAALHDPDIMSVSNHYDENLLGAAPVATKQQLQVCSFSVLVFVFVFVSCFLSY